MEYANRHSSAADTVEQRHPQLPRRREAAGDLATAARDLANLKVERFEIIKVINALDIFVQLMGQIKTTFTNVRIFWESVAKMCASLKEYDEAELEDKSVRHLRLYVEKQMVQWIALGRLNYLPYNGVNKAKEKVDEA